MENNKPQPEADKPRFFPPPPRSTWFDGRYQERLQPVELVHDYDDNGNQIIIVYRK